jgi:Lhr-like helicase
MISVRLEHAPFLQDIHAVVVDELHAFAGDDRGWHLMFLLARLERLTGRRLQRIGLSATVGNPSELLHWFTVQRGGRVVGEPRSTTSGDVTADCVGSIHNAVTVIARLHRGERRLVFADSRTRVEEIAAGLRAAGVRTFVSHASLSLDEPLLQRSRTASSSLPRPSSLDSTSATSTALSRLARHRASRRSCSAWGGQGAGAARRGTVSFLQPTMRSFSSLSP